MEFGEGSLKTKISVHKKAFKEISLDEVPNRLSTDKENRKNSKAQSKINLIFGNGKEKGRRKRRLNRPVKQKENQKVMSWNTSALRRKDQQD